MQTDHLNHWRVLVLHNCYQHPGGEDISTHLDVEMLRQAGHAVTLLEKDNREIEHLSRLQKALLVGRAAWNPTSYAEIYRFILKLRPNLLHVQNFFPLYSPAVHAAARDAEIPSIQHLRNFRFGCLNGYLLRNQHICEDCVGKNPWRGVVHRCYRNSLPASLGVWNTIAYNRWRGTWNRDVSAFITPSSFAARKLVEIGLPAERLYVKPNTCRDPLGDRSIAPLPEQPRFLFLGRLSAEKGVALLLRAWETLAKPDWQLDIVGDGDDATELQRFASERGLANAVFCGFLHRDQIALAIQQATAVVVPSQWYETFGRVVIEAFACGRGAIASDLGALSELVEEGRTGFCVKPDDLSAWVERLRWCGNNPAAMARIGQLARQTYLERYTPAVTLRQLEAIYARVLSGRVGSQ